VYVATGDGEYGADRYSDAIVALAPKTLQLKDWFSPAKSDFIASPVIFEHGNRQLLVAANKDGRLYLLDTASLGGTDHRTPLAHSAQYSTGSVDVGALTEWEEGGAQYVATPFTGAASSDVVFPTRNGAVTNGGIAVFKVVDQNGSPAFQPAWISRDMNAPLPVTAVNGVIVALASGEYRTNDSRMTAAERAQRSGRAVLYVLDAATGKELWTSGTTITSFVHGGGPVVGGGNVFFTTYDGTLWAFGIPLNISGAPANTSGN
jgi:outer membrane protein assembly factor BamB